MARRSKAPQSSSVEEARALMETARDIDAQGSVADLDEDQVIERFDGLVIQTVQSLRTQLAIAPDHQPDMLADGRLGLLEAWRRFDPTQGGAFATFAYYRLKGSVIDGLRKRGAMHRSRARSQARLSQAAAHLGESTSSGYTAMPSHQERLEHVDRTVRQMAAAHLIIQEAQAEAEQSRRRHPLRSLLDAELRGRLTACVGVLPEIEQTVLEAVYFQDRSITDIGQELGFSRSWTCRVHARALERLHELLSAEARAPDPEEGA